MFQHHLTSILASSSSTILVNHWGDIFMTRNVLREYEGLPSFMPEIPNVKNANRHIPFSACLTLNTCLIQTQGKAQYNMQQKSKQALSLDMFCGSIIQVFLFTKEFQNASLRIYTLLQDV